MAKRKYLIIAVTGLTINLVETWLFGWHWKAQSGAESFWDDISLALILWGVVGDILTNLHIHKHHYDKSRTTVNTKTVKIAGKPNNINYNFGTTEKETRKLLSRK